MTLLDITYCIIILCVRQNMSYCLHLSLLFVVCAFLYINVHVLLLKKKKKKKKKKRNSHTSTNRGPCLISLCISSHNYVCGTRSSHWFSVENQTPVKLCLLWYQDHQTPWWRHQMETFSASLALCAGNSPVTGEFPAQRPVTQSFDVFFHLRLNKRLSKQSQGWWFETPSRSLWRHCNSRTYAPSCGLGYNA